MAQAAGIVNRDGLANDQTFRDAMSASAEEIQQLAAGVRSLIFDIFPATIEVVWPKQRSVGWGIGPKKFTEQFAYLMLFKGHVTLGFYHGADLSDPDGLLPDTGGRQVAGTLSMRSLKLTGLDDVDQPALRSLIDAAACHQLSVARDCGQAPD
ncbi:MAG: DUF1801 domain-containing protein [Geodermatophilaceae bacterium]|nr:DUF1801 domain-containing protein [Geodermatophilaceae bacterium]